MNPLQMINAFVLPVIVINEGDRIAAMNHPAQAMLGTDCTGLHYITALRQPALLDAIEGVQRDGDARTTRYLGNSHGADTTFRVHVARAGSQVVLSFEDTTALEAAGQMRRDFVANVSHEMRTPLTAISGFIETLRGPARDDVGARDRFLGMMQQEAGRLQRLVDDLLSLARVEDSERDRPLGHVNLTDLCRRTVAEMAPHAQGSTLAFTAPDGDISVQGDADQLRQVLVNLIENALKYGGAQVDVTLHPPATEARLRGMGVRLEVRDDGAGIDSHHIARLTERFYRVDSHRARDVGGTGLGLAIVKHILNRHRGRLLIASEVGQGSVFTAILPV